MVGLVVGLLCLLFGLVVSAVLPAAGPFGLALVTNLIAQGAQVQAARHTGYLYAANNRCGDWVFTAWRTGSGERDTRVRGAALRGAIISAAPTLGSSSADLLCESILTNRRRPTKETAASPHLSAPATATNSRATFAAVAARLSAVSRHASARDCGSRMIGNAASMPHA